MFAAPGLAVVVVEEVVGAAAGNVRVGQVRAATLSSLGSARSAMMNYELL